MLEYTNIIYRSAKLAQIVKEIHKYQLKMLSVQVTRWTGFGKQSQYLATEYTIIWSDRGANNHLQIVAPILDKEASRTLLKWNPANERLLYVCLNSKVY